MSELPAIDRRVRIVTNAQGHYLQIRDVHTGEDISVRSITILNTMSAIAEAHVLVIGGKTPTYKVETWLLILDGAGQTSPGIASAC